MEIIVLKVDYLNKTYALLSESDALNDLVFNNYDCQPDHFGDVFVSFVKFNSEKFDVGYEFYRSNYELYLEEVAGRIVNLQQCGFVDVSEFYK